MIQLTLNTHIKKVLSGLNISHIPGERLERDALSLVEVARYCHTRGGGAVACLDAQFAYDRTRISFLKLILEAMKLLTMVKVVRSHSLG